MTALGIFKNIYRYYEYIFKSDEGSAAVEALASMRAYVHNSVIIHFCAYTFRICKTFLNN